MRFEQFPTRIASLTTIVTACLLAPLAHAADINGATAERLSPSEIRLSWEASGAPVDVYIGTDPEAEPEEMTLISDDDADGGHVAEADVAPRPYFLLVAQNGETVRVAERVLPLEGGMNFRDLGGYETADGKAVKWGKLYRSAAMNNLTMTDYNYLRTLDINVICDLRSTEERENKPTRWQEFGVEDYLTRDYALDFMEQMPDTGGEKLTAQQASELMAGFYKDVPARFATSYRQMFHGLLDGKAPLAFNCSAGKDRTGVASALLLTALGVPRDQVIADYLLSNRYYRPSADRDGASETETRLMALFSEDALRTLMGVEDRFIKAAFAGIDEQYGGINGYFEAELGMGEPELTALRSMLLQ